MGWSKWFSHSGDKVSTKSERSGNRSSEHTLRSSGGSKRNHSHVVTHTNTSTGRKTAHGAPPKDKR